MERTKIVKNVDHEVWKRFVGSCIADGVKTGHRLSDILRKHNKGLIKEDNNG